jgi:hypothetical protein
MLRLDLLETKVLRLSGRLTDGCREEVESFVTSHRLPAEQAVEITEVIYADRSGEESLGWLAQRGARFRAESSYALYLCERLRLPILKQACRGRGRR